MTIIIITLTAQDPIDVSHPWSYQFIVYDVQNIFQWNVIEMWNILKRNM